MIGLEIKKRKKKEKKIEVKLEHGSRRSYMIVLLLNQLLVLLFLYIIKSIKLIEYISIRPIFQEIRWIVQ